MDVAIIRAWDRLHEQLCPDCGRPVALHAHDKPGDYLPASYTCPAAQQLDAFLARHRAERKAEYEAAHKAGRNPEAGIRWFTHTQAEGLPRTDEEGMVWSWQQPL